MKPSTKRLVSLMIAMLLVFAALMIHFNLTVPAYSDADSVRGTLYAEQQFLNDQKNAIGQVKKLLSDYQGKDKPREAVAMALPLSLDEAGVLHQLQSMANLNNLSLQSLTISPSAAQNLNSGQTGTSTAIIRPIGSINFQFHIIGAYEDFKKFLRNIETNIRIFDIKSISIEPLVNSTQDKYGFDLTVVTYYQNP